MGQPDAETSEAAFAARPGRAGGRLAAAVALTILLTGSLAAPLVHGAMRIAAAERDWTARLEALSPQDPMAYFELGEEVADVASAEHEHALARRLFALAGALDPGRLGRSACLAIAWQTGPLDDAERRRLLALAELLDPRGPVAPTVAGGGEAWSTETTVAAVDVISAHRRGDGAAVLEGLSTPGVAEVLRRWEGLIPGGLRRLEREAQGPQRTLRPTLTERETTDLLLLQLALLQGADRAWSADLAVSDGRPLVEVDPSRLAESLGVDPRLSVFRGGRWSEAGGP